jgi:hypothetical protein
VRRKLFDALLIAGALTWLVLLEFDARRRRTC